MTGQARIQVFILALILFAACTVSADQAPPRPRIGLALGGGGARGAAHVGALKALAEHRIPIDYVSGTSMGAIVGALYALGQSPDEIEARLLGMEWDQVFADRARRDLRVYRKKAEEDAGFLPLEFGIRDRTIIPARGVIAGQKLTFAFDIPEFHTAGYSSFDTLPYPFRCVATNLLDGGKVVLDHGSLLRAVRASMSIPGIFPPVIIDGTPLVDGGLVANVPVDEVRRMGADIVIAIDVCARPEDRTAEMLDSMRGILEQTYNIGQLESVRGQLAEADHVIRIKLDEVRAQDFRKVGETIEPGRRAVLAQIAELERYSLDADGYATHLAGHRPLPPEGIPIERIEVVNRSAASDEAIRRAISQPLGRNLDFRQLQKDLDALYDYGVFEVVDFMLPVDDRGRTLQVIGRSKAHAPWIILAGLHLSGGQDGKSEVGAKLRLSRLELNSTGGEWRNDIQLGRIMGAKTGFHQPLSGSRRPFLEAALTWREAKQFRYADFVSIGEFDSREFKGEIDLGYGLGTVGEIRAGVLSGRLRSRNRAVAGSPEFDGPVGGFTGRLVIDTFDACVLPRRGLGAGLDFFVADPAFGSGLDHAKLSAHLAGAVSRGENTFGFRLRGGGATDDTPAFDSFTLGGLHDLSGLLDDQLRGRAFSLAAAGWSRRIHDSPGLFPTSLHLGLEFEAGNTWEDASRARLDDLRVSANVSLTAKTWLGPATAAYSLCEGGHDTFYLVMGLPVDLLD